MRRLRQWRSNALRGHCSTVTCGLSLSLPSTSPPSPFPPLPQPSPTPAAKRPPNPARGSGERCKLPQRGLGRSPSRNRIWCILAFRHLVAPILTIFLRGLPKIFLLSHYSGAPGARVPRFIEPPEPAVPTPLAPSMSAIDVHRAVTAASEEIVTAKTCTEL